MSNTNIESAIRLLNEVITDIHECVEFQSDRSVLQEAKKKLILAATILAGEQA